jgi:hypothetical protein
MRTSEGDHIKEDEKDVRTTHGINDMHTKLWSENLKERDHLQDQGIDRNIKFEWILGKQGRKVWTE